MVDFSNVLLDLAPFLVYIILSGNFGNRQFIARCHGQRAIAGISCAAYPETYSDVASQNVFAAESVLGC